jgi:hypothetical protein
MKLSTMFLGPIVAIGMASTASARDYHDLVAEGYRWVTIDGPYACPAKEDLRQITRNQSDLNELHMVEEVRAYFLIRGALVKIIQQDARTGMELQLPNETGELFPGAYALVTLQVNEYWRFLYSLPVSFR